MIKKVPFVLIFLFITSLMNVFGENYKFNAYKTFGKSGEYSFKNLTATEIKTDDPASNDIRIDVEMIISQYFGFSVGWVMGKSDYELTINGTKYYPTDDENSFTFGFKSYFNAQQASYFAYNFYAGIDYTLFKSSFSLSTPPTVANKYEIDSNISGVGVAVNLGAEVQFATSGIRLSVLNQDTSANGETDSTTINYSLKNMDILVGIYLFY